jgi:hypothetical protein
MLAMSSHKSAANISDMASATAVRSEARPEATMWSTLLELATIDLVPTPDLT